MKKDKLLRSFIATLFGLLVAGIAFYVFQATKIVDPSNTKVISFTTPTPMPAPSIFLTLDRPKDEEVVTSKILIIGGKTNSNAAVVVMTETFEDVITPSSNGDFSITALLDDGQNIIEVTAISPNGESATIKRTVTYSQEQF